MADSSGQPKTDIIQRYQQLTAQISRAAQDSTHAHHSVRLLAVSKRQSTEAIRQLYLAGQRDFGENYVSEAVSKMTALDDLEITWHYIGPIQSNKTRQISTEFDWVHSVDRLRILRRLHEQRPPDRAPLNCLIQINLAGEAQKSGARLTEVPELVQAFENLNRLKLRGFMLIPPQSDNPATNKVWFAAAHALYRQQQVMNADIDTLSMGMSNDLDVAIAEGSNCVRVGTALFGPRSV